MLTSLPLDDPACDTRAVPPAPSDAFGPHEGLFETMRADGGRIPWIERHLDRLEASAATLGLTGIASRDEIRAAALGAVTTVGRGPLRVRATATRDGAVAVDVEPIGAMPQPTAVTLRGAWDPSAALREHKTTRYSELRRAAVQARARGAGHALLLDRAGDLGEAATASVILRIGGRDRTPPIRGILPGVARARVLERLPVEVSPISEQEWRDASEIVLVNALRRTMPVLSVDGRDVGARRAGPLAAKLAALLDGERVGEDDARCERAAGAPDDRG